MANAQLSLVGRHIRGAGNATDKAAVHFAAGSTAIVGGASATLAESMLKGMVLGKLKIAATLVLAVSLAGVGAGLIAHQVQTEKQPKKLEPAPARDNQSKVEAQEQLRTDYHGDPLPVGALARMGTIHLRHPGNVIGIAFSRDGKTIASAGLQDGSIRLWDVATGRPHLRIDSGEEYLTALASSPDGKVLAITGYSRNQDPRLRDGSVRLWDRTTGKQFLRIERANWRPRDISFSPDGTTLATSAELDGSIQLWDARTGKERLRISTPAQEVFSLAFSPDGRTLASTCPSDAIRLWDPASGKELRKLEARTDLFWRLVFSPDGTTLAALARPLEGRNEIKQNDIVLWDMASGKIRRLRGRPDAGWYAAGLAFSPDGRTLASTADDRTVFLWDVATGKQTGQLTGQPAGVSTLAFSPDGDMLASSGLNSTIHLWDMTTEKEIRPDARTHGPVQAVTLSPDGKILASGGSLDQAIHLWEVATGKEIGRLAGRPSYSLAFSPDGTLLSSGDQLPVIRLWDMRTRKETRRFVSHQSGGIHSLLFSPDGKTLASQGGASEIRLTEAATGKILWTLDPPGGSCSLALSPNGRILAIGSYHGTIRLWDVATQRQIREFVGQDGVPTLAFSPDGKSLVSTSGDQLPSRPSDRTIRLWEVATGKVRRCLGEHRSLGVVPSCVAFSPDGKMVASGGVDSVVRVWDVAAGGQLREFVGHQGWVNTVAFSANGGLLVSGGHDTTVLVWDVSGLVQRTARQTVSLSPQKLNTLWADLGDEDASKAYQALCTLVAVPKQSLLFLQEHLRAIPPIDPQRIAHAGGKGVLGTARQAACCRAMIDDGMN